jgi:uncharacterized protein YnzC (UPF0291/DUF896 family)
MLDKHKMNRINELARASKTRVLDEAEKTEQAVLRAEYLAKFRESFKAHLDRIEVVDGDGHGN